MKKRITIGIAALFLISGYGACANASGNQTILEKTDICAFSSVSIHEENGETTVDLPEETSHVDTPGSYAVPVVTRIYTFPFKTRIIDVTVQFSDFQQTIVSQPIRSAPQPTADALGGAIARPPLIGEASAPPSFSYHIAAGLGDDTVVTYLAVHLYPVHYNPTERTLYSAENAEITISYILPDSQGISAAQYELVVISPKQFAKALQPLVTFKISKGLTTKLVTTQEICKGTYFPTTGRDCAEEFKYFIKNAFDQWGTKYVLLVGGRRGGIAKETWLVPARYSQLNDGSEGSYLTDLYFADLYDANGNFSSWDSNNNGVFAEWTTTTKDVLDMYPEVYVGRLPCTSLSQVKTMVNKIITYESTAYGSEWFARFVGVAGDTYPEANHPYYEGEMATNASFGQLQGLGFTASFLWTSNGRFTGPDPVITEINKGCGFVHFSGHGNPMVWANHPPRNTSFIEGPNAFEMRKLSNGDQQPIVIVGGCHNAQFNTSLLNILKGILKDGLKYFKRTPPYGRFWYNEWIPRCWGWAMTSQTQGGAIALIANTGLGYGEPGVNTLTEKGRFLEWLFFKAYKDGKERLGETHAADLMYYMNEHPPMNDQVDCKIVQEWALFGDPSLQIGGYAP